MSKYRITLAGKTYELEIESLDGAATAAKPAAVSASVSAPTQIPSAPNAAPAPAAATPVAGGSGTIISPMPGTVLKVQKAVGDVVKTGDVVLVLEAMKMENEILAPNDGTIVRMDCTAGQTVAGGTVLCVIQ